ncbi:MAG: pyruvate, phosphate dikinase [Microbacterium sp.]
MSTTMLKTDLTVNVVNARTNDRAVLGGKGAGLVDMTAMGLRVPEAFVLSTACCAEYFEHRRMPDDLVSDVRTRLAEIEASSGKTFGAGPVPLLLSVRSGAPVSMPGMMDTVLNLGLSRDAAIALAVATSDVKFVADVLARFHAMYAEIVLDVLEPAPSPVDEVLARLGADADAGEVYDAVWARLQQALDDDGEPTVPDDPLEQLDEAIEAVFRSWNTRRAIAYRELHGIDHSMGTAVVVQEMVFGNRDERSGSGVVFSRNPVTGEPGLYGEYLAASQGEDVVAGIRTPDQVQTLRQSNPELFEELVSTVARLERERRDVLDIEFTVESGRLYFLQVRSAKRTARAAVRIATDFISEFGAAADHAIQAVTADHLRSLSQPRFDESALDRARSDGRLLARGTGASPGHVTGIVAFTSERAEQLAAEGHAVILARAVTSPTDLHGMIAAKGVVTATGGSTSHAAVVARALGCTCVVGCDSLVFDEDGASVRVGERTLGEGDQISLDGDAGEVYAGAIDVVTHRGDDTIGALTRHCLQTSGADLFMRAASVEEIRQAQEMGAAGVVVAAADLLATHTRFAEVIEGIIARQDDKGRFDALSDVLAEAFAPLFDAARGLEFGVRAIDFLVDETSEMLHSGTVLTQQPMLAMPLGSPELVNAHLNGLARALAAISAPDAPRVHLSVRNVSDPAEAALVREFAAQTPPVHPGAYVASPRGALHSQQIAAEVGHVWVELRLLQASMFGVPGHMLLTAEPFEEYASQGLISANPREQIDDSVRPLLQRVAASAKSETGVGIRVTGRVSQPLIGELYELGLRRFAVDFAEAGPASLALAAAARRS